MTPVVAAVLAYGLLWAAYVGPDNAHVAYVLFNPADWPALRTGFGIFGVLCAVLAFGWVRAAWPGRSS